LFYINSDIKAATDKLQEREQKVSSAIRIYDPAGIKENLEPEAEIMYQQLSSVKNERKTLELAMCIPLPIEVVEKFDNGGYEGKTLKEVARELYDSINLNGIISSMNAAIK